MKKLPFILFILIAHAAVAQKNITSEIEKIVTINSVRSSLTFLASDEMRGRDTGSPEIDIAAKYLAAEFEELGLSALPGAANYFQTVDLERIYATTQFELKAGEKSFTLNEQVVAIETTSGEWSGEWLYVGYGSPQDIPSDVKGKMILSIAGASTSVGREPIFEASEEKLARLIKAGAAGLIEITPNTVSWNSVMATFGKSIRTDCHQKMSSQKSKARTRN